MLETVKKNPFRYKKCSNHRNHNAEFLGKLAKTAHHGLTQILKCSGNKTFMQRRKKGRISGTCSYPLFKLPVRSNLLQILAKLFKQRLPAKLSELELWKDTGKYGKG